MVAFLTPPPFVRSSGAPAAISFCARAESVTNIAGGGTYSFPSHSIGTASADRYIAVCVSLAQTVSITRDVTAVTVAGQSCSEVIDISPGGNTAGCMIWITTAPVTSGTTGTVVVTVTGNTVNCGIATYALTGLQSNVATDTESTSSDNTNMSLNILSNGVAIAATVCTTTGTHTWTGVTERYDQTVETSLGSHSGGDTTSLTAQTLTIRVDSTATGTFRTCCASFR